MNHVLMFSHDETGGSLDDVVSMRCKQLKIACSISDHPNLNKVCEFALACSLGDIHSTRMLFERAAFLLHDSSTDELDEWFDLFVEAGDEDIHSYILDPVFEDIRSDSIQSLGDLKARLEVVTAMDMHHLKDDIFSLACISTSLNCIGINIPIHDAHIIRLMSIANRYVDIICAFVPDF